MTPLAALFDEHQLFHSDLQIDSFITQRSGGTVYGCYKQALRELWKRFRGLRDLNYQRELLAVDLDKLAHDAETATDQFDRRTAQVNLKAKRLSRIELDKATEDTEREFLRFYAQACSLRVALNITDDNPLTDERRAEFDREMWEHGLRCKVANDLLSHGRPQGATVSLIQSLPPEMRRRVVDECLKEPSYDKLVNWYLAYAPNIPERIAIPADKERALLECSRLSDLSKL